MAKFAGYSERHRRRRPQPGQLCARAVSPRAWLFGPGPFFRPSAATASPILVERHCAAASRLAGRCASIAGVDIVHPVVLNQVADERRQVDPAHERHCRRARIADASRGPRPRARRADPVRRRRLPRRRHARSRSPSPRSTTGPTCSRSGCRTRTRSPTARRSSGRPRSRSTPAPRSTRSLALIGRIGAARPGVPLVPMGYANQLIGGGDGEAASRARGGGCRRAHRRGPDARRGRAVRGGRRATPGSPSSTSSPRPRRRHAAPRSPPAAAGSCTASRSSA